MVPVCPDTSGYVLGDGIGDVLPKGIEYSVMFESVFKKHEIPTIFDIQVADVEGLDPVILKNTGETTDSHFMKTKGTIEKGRSEIERRKLGSVVAVRSMLEAFTEAGLDFREVQIEAANKIRSSQNRQVANVVDGLIKERVRLGNFVRFDDATKRELVINELASYAAFGEMSGGDAIILSPDAKSAVPAYHFSIDDNNKFSPVIYAS